MTTREAVHALLDRVDDEDLVAAEEALRPLVPLTPDELHAILDAAPLEDEPLSEDEIAAIERGIADIAAGRVQSDRYVEALLASLNGTD
ncbi:MAG: hypothetical protein ACKVVT_02915 [Dehalococcoidia bacterium]